MSLAWCGRTTVRTPVCDKGRPLPLRCCLRSSVGQSKSLLMTRSQVRVLPGARLGVARHRASPDDRGPGTPTTPQAGEGSRSCAYWPRYGSGVTPTQVSDRPLNRQQQAQPSSALPVREGSSRGSAARSATRRAADHGAPRASPAVIDADLRLTPQGRLEPAPARGAVVLEHDMTLANAVPRGRHRTGAGPVEESHGVLAQPGVPDPRHATDVA